MSARWAGAPPGNVTGAGANRPRNDEQLAGGTVAATVQQPTDRKLLRGGRVVRQTLRRSDGAGCLACDWQQTGYAAYLLASRHTLTTGHPTIAGREVAFHYSPAGGGRHD